MLPPPLPPPPLRSLSHRPSVEFQGVAGWPAQPKLMPTVIVWTHGGQHVEVEGSFDNWSSRTALQRSGRDFTIMKLLPPGVYQYKFIVDGVWRYAPDQAAMYDEMGNINNVIEVHEFVPENLDGLEGFEPPPSPSTSYNRPTASPDDFARDAPQLPQHLHLTLLNVPPALDPTTSLPRPQHVILKHLYSQRQPSGSLEKRALILGLTQRYKSKYITTVIYKPGYRAQRPAGPPPHVAPPDADMAEDPERESAMVE